MIFDFDNTVAPKEMLLENEAIFAGFTADGIELARVTEMEFVSDFAEVSDAKDCQEAFNEHRANCLSVFGFHSCYTTLSPYPEVDGFDLYFKGIMEVNVSSVTRAEYRLDLLCKEFGGSRIAWRFEVPERDPEMRVH